MKVLGLKYSKVFRKFLANIFRKRIGWRKKLTKFLKFLYLLLLFPVEIAGDLLFLWKRFSSKKITTPKKILIVKIDQLGDVLFSTFLVPLVKEKCKDAEIHYLINPKTKTILDKNPNINKLHFWQDPFLHFILGRKENRKKLSFWQIIRDNNQTLKLLKKEKYDVVINARAFSPSSNFFWKLAKPRLLVSFDISEQSFLADYWAQYDFYEEEWKNYLKLLEPLGIGKIEFSSQFYNFDDQGLKNKFLREKEKLVVVSPISFDKERLWEVKNWQKVISFLVEKNFQVCLIGLESQKDYLLKIKDNVISDKVKILTDLSIPQLASLLRKSLLLLGIDAFPIHLGISLKKHIICLVNTEVYYLPHYSKIKKFVDVKSMVPLVKDIVILPAQKTGTNSVIKICNEMTQRVLKRYQELV